MMKLILEGALFSECVMAGNSRNGMLRIAEEITRRLAAQEDVGLSFFNNFFIRKYHRSLEKYINAQFPANPNTIISEEPPFFMDFIKYKSIFKKFPVLMYFPVKSKLELADFQLYHSFYYPLPSAVRKSSVKKCFTFLDLIALRLPGYSPELKRITREIIRDIRENHAIAISDFSRNDLLDYDPMIDPAQVFVSPLAADSSLFYVNKDSVQWEMARKKYNLPENYFLCISSNDKRKNIPHLLRCFSDFVLQEKPSDCYLVLAGNSTHSRQLLDDLGISVEVRRRICFPEKPIAESDLSIVYSRCLSFFFMSRYEGFGLPVLEAMQCGAPVVAANCTSVPEVAGNACILLSPDDSHGLCSVMIELYRGLAYRDRLSKASIIQASKFSWDRAAGEYKAIFEKIINN